MAFAAPVGVAALLSAFRSDVPSVNAVLVLVVVAVAVGGSRLACTAWFDFFLIEPYLTLRIADRDDVETPRRRCWSSSERPRRWSSSERPHRWSSSERPHRWSSSERPHRWSSSERPHRWSSSERPHRWSSSER